MKYLIVTTLFLLTSCGLLPSKFDNVEYGKLIELHVASSTPVVGDDWCRSADLNRLQYLSSQLKVYSNYRLNKNIASIYNEIDKLVIELKDRENPSPAYCKIKRQNISKVTENAIKVFGKRGS